MRAQSLAVAGLLLLVSTVALTSAQSQTTGQVPPPPEEGVASGPDTFLETRRRAQDEDARAIQGAGRGENLNGLRSVVRANLRTRAWTIKPTGATAAELANQDMEAVAQFLATIGYSPADVAPGAAGGTELIQSAGRLVLGGSGMQDKVRVAPVVVVAELVGVSTDASTDQAYRSTATLKVVEALKGEVAAGQQFMMRQRSGPLADGTIVRLRSEFSEGDQGQFLLFLSPAAYEVRSQRRLPAGSQPYYASILVPYRVNGTELDPMGEVEHPPVTLTEVRSLAR